MAAENRCQSFLLFTHLSLDNRGYMCPPKKSIILSALLYALSLSTTFAETGKVIDNSYLENDGDSYPLKTSITGTDQY